MKRTIALLLSILMLLSVSMTGCGVADEETKEGFDATFDFIEEGLEVLFVELPEAFRDLLREELKGTDFEDITKKLFAYFSTELSFELNEEGTEYTVVDIGGYKGKKLVIPEEWEGLPVTKIGCGAFSGTNIKDVTIPDSITRIEDSAFGGCIYLEEIIIPKGVTYIGDSAFSSCEDLEYVYIPEGVTYIGDNAFAYCEKLEDVIIPSTVEHLGSYIFYHCHSLTHAGYNGTSEEWNAIEKRPEGISKEVIFLEQ